MMINGKKTIFAAVILVVAVTTCAWAEDAYEVEWMAQIGTSGRDYSYSVAVDASGNAYISGRTTGNLGGPNAGESDAFLSKFDSGGNEVWATQLGTSSHDESDSIAVDASGNVYITGMTFGDLGGPRIGERDAFLSKFDSGGNELWTTQIGTSEWEQGWSVAVDASSNAYITGWTKGDLGGPNARSADAFLGKFDTDGNEVWMTQIGTILWDAGHSVAVDASGNAYISGATGYNLGGVNSNPGKSDAFLSKFDSDGNGIWTTQIGTSPYDDSYGVAVDASGNSYITGYTEGDLAEPNAGIWDVFVSKFDSDGSEVWTTQIGTSEWDSGRSISVDIFGNAYITGFTRGDIGGPNAGDIDAFLIKFDSGGNELWSTQLGTSTYDTSSGIAMDTSGNVYISGTTDGDLGGPSAGGYDAFLVKYEVPEPATLVLMAGGLPFLLKRKRVIRRGKGVER
jgi:hypothetical protein